MKVNKPLRRLPLSGTNNTRDLGGYPCEGGAVKWGVFLRSDNPSALTQEDIAYLQAYGVTAAVDLRKREEAAHMPSALEGVKGIQVHNISMSDNIHNIDIQGDIPGSMSGLYITLLDESQEEIHQIMQVMAQAEGGVLFHCAVGKDRTGVVAMLLLKLVGVSDGDVVANYAVTEIYMRDIFAQQADVFQRADMPEYVLKSTPVSMERVLQHLAHKYETAEKYLLGIGLSADTIARLRAKLVEPATEM